MSDNDQGNDAAGSFSVYESSSSTMSGGQTGNSITSAYSLSETSSESYSMTETGVPYNPLSFSISETGSTTSTTTETGDRITGTYSRTNSGTDTYHMTETGMNWGGTYTESVTGTETYTLTEGGNPANQTYNRTTTGGGTYTRTDTGPGATLPSNSGSTNYNLTESADARAGQLSQSGTDYDRYNYLLERFNNVANTGNGNDPGNMNFSPVGQAFVDPNPDGTTNDGPSPGTVDPELAAILSGLGPLPTRAQRDANLSALGLIDRPREVTAARPMLSRLGTSCVSDPYPFHRPTREECLRTLSFVGQTVLGALEVAGGIVSTLSGSPVGVAVIFNGIDNIASGIYGGTTGQTRVNLTTRILIAQGVHPEAAEGTNNLLPLFAGAGPPRAVAGIRTGLTNTTRLTADELATGQRLEARLGTTLRESLHEGAEFVDELGHTYDALGVPRASQFWNEKQFINSINEHLLKSNDFTVIDLTGFTADQIAAVNRHLSSLTPQQLGRIIKIGF